MIIITKKDFAIKTNASACLKKNTIESYPGIEKSSMKSLFFPIVFAYYFVIRLAGKKVVPIVKHHHLEDLKKRLAMAVRFHPIPIGYALLFQRKERAAMDLETIGAIRAGSIPVSGTMIETRLRFILPEACLFTLTNG